MKSEGSSDEADQGDIPEADRNFAPSPRKLDAAALVEKYRPFLKSIAAAEFPDLLKTRVDASDIVQETLLRAHQQVSQFQGTTEVELQGWLRGILRHLLTDTFRFNTRRRRDINRDGRMPDIDPSCVDDTPSEQVRKRESWDAIWQAVSALPEDYRTVILMHHQYNLSFADIGERLQKSPDAVRMLWGRAILALTNRLKSHR